MLYFYCMPSVHIIVQGKVQGVFFRATAREVAGEIGVSGTVQNTEQGAVEIRATGSQEQLDQFVAWCRKGPSRARVSDVVITQTDEQTFEGFQVVRS